MTKLLKKVERETLALEVFAGKYKSRKIIVALEPGDMITFRIKGTQQSFTVPLGYCYNLAQLSDSKMRYHTAMDRYKQKVKAGYKRLRKPKMAQFPFHKILFDAFRK